MDRKEILFIFITLLLILLTWLVLSSIGGNILAFVALLIAFLGLGWWLGRFYPTAPLKKGNNMNDKDFVLERERELLYDSLFTNNSDGILVLSVEGQVMDTNPIFLEMSGYTLNELKKIPLSKFIVEDDLEKKYFHTRKALAGEAQEYTVYVVNKEGAKLFVLIKMIPIIVNDEVVGLFEIIKDLTETKKMEEMMYRSDKLNAIGQLAAGVAHEIRNPLTSLKGFLQLSKPHLRGEYVEIMENELERINQIVGEFLFLSKPQKVISDVVIFIQPEALLKKVEIHTELLGDIPPIHCEENQLKQVFINLLKNAMEAMPSGGNIYIRVHLQNDGISVKIEDEGVGIPQDKLGKIGQPFFTTKEKGNGLGVLVTQRIIEAHGGTFSIESEENVGTIVEILFPLHEGTWERTAERESSLSI